MTRAILLAVAVVALLLNPSGSSSAAPADPLVAVQRVLDAQVTAVQQGDRAAYLGTIDPEAPAAFRDAQVRRFDGLRSVPLAIPDLLREVYGLTRDAALVNSQSFYGERYPYGVLAPALATAHFAVTGLGSRPGI